MFAARWVQLATGKDYLSDVPPWFTEIGAKRVLIKVGGLEAIMDRKLTRIDRNYAADGDIAFHQDSLRVYSGRYICGPGPNGLVYFDRGEAICAWRCS